MTPKISNLKYGQYILIPIWTRSFFRAWDQSIPCERTWKFPDISYFRDLRQTRGAKKIPKRV
jgi:hypothetical protein